VPKPTVALTSKHGAHAPVGFRSWGVVSVVVIRRAESAPPYVENLLFAFLSFEFLPNLAEFDEAMCIIMDHKSLGNIFISNSLFSARPPLPPYSE
jgi:hypothetical protein